MNMIFNLLWKDETGATAVEYGLIAALVSVAIIGSLLSLGDSLEGVFTFINDALGDALGTAQGS